MDEYQQLDKSLKNEYTFVNNLKNTDDVVINVLQNKITGERILVKYFNGTAEVYKKLLTLTHPNLPKVYKVVQQDNKCIVVEEFIDGITIGDTLEIERYSTADVRKIISQLCDVLSLIHRNGIVHRDIKPENIIIDNSGNLKLIDFNISRINKENNSKDTVILGTTGFAAPEQYGISETDERSDIYSIGILINVMLTGDHPSKKLCDKRWRQIVNKCTRINPKERYASVKALMADVRYYKVLVPVGLLVIIVLVVITVVVCSGRDKLSASDTETTLAEQPSETTKITESSDNAMQEENESAEETTTIDEQVTVAPSTEESTTVEEPTTPAPTQPPVAVEPTTVAPTEAPTEELNYIITLKDNIITVVGNGEISKTNFTQSYLSTTEKNNLRGAVFEEGITNIPSNAFVGCQQFQNITIPGTVTKIGKKALCGTLIDMVELPDSVKDIEEEAFMGCRNLSKIKMSKSLKYIGKSAFSGCTFLYNIALPDSVEYIGEGAFSGCGIRSVVLPSKLLYLEKQTFICCEYLNGIILPENLESIGELCFSQCYNLQSIIIPPSVTFIADNAFAGCNNLVVYVTSGSYAEQYCNKNHINYECIDSVELKTIEISPVLDHLENSTFANDVSLEEIKLHNDFVAIDQYCFFGCINFKRIVIPPSVTFIGENAFLGCNNLVIYVTPGSYAEQYCKDNYLDYEYVN